ncbi:hypothetical protein CDL15_Pgr004141 [Punica granatum]|uniref:Filament-like plant protein 7 n=1 Tax=Punica granatum TaxID=22663 RepID=A0A218XGX1_PUNGR|nr:hypothetical protein CDL15_Pgr004141 [Punica granatum]
MSNKSLNEKLASVLTDCHEKDDLIVKHAKAAEEAIADSKKAEARAALLKRELDDALGRAEAANEKSTRLETEAKEYSEKLSSLQEESEQRKKSLEEKLSEVEKRLAFSTLESTRLCSELSGKDKLIEDLLKSKSDAESEFNALMGRLDSIEKENAFLKYEFCVLEKEVSIRNEELEYNRRAAEAAHQKHLESTRKITKLEGECQRLRTLMQKRIPGPTDLARMKREVRVLGRNQSETGKGRKPLEVPRSSTKIGFLMERLGDVEEENKSLKELVALKEAELISSKVLNSETSSRLLELEVRVSELSRGQGMELAIKEPLPKESSSPLAGSSGSWANALISELEHFRNEKLTNALKLISSDSGALEMDKLAIVSVAPPSEKRTVTEISFDWLQVVLNAMMEQTRVSNRSLLELFEDVRIALGFMNQPGQESGKLLPSSSNMAESVSDSEPLQISGYLTWKSPKASLGSDNWSNSIRKIIKLIEGFTPASTKNSDYFVHVFQQKNSELIAVREKFLTACNNILEEKFDLEMFVEELASALDWIMNSDTMPRKNVSNVRDRIKKNIGRTEFPGEEDPMSESDTENKAESGSPHSPSVEQDEKKQLELELKNMESAKTDVEAKLNKAEECIGTLTLELKTVEESKRVLEDQMENQKSINEDLDTQLTMAKSKLNEVLQKFSSLEVEHEEKNNCCEELESKCLELQLQLESVAKETPKQQELMLSRTGWEITAASVKLAECQETILNLGRQLKALSSPREAAFLDRVFSRPNTCKILNKRACLRDRLLAEDDVSNTKKDAKSPENRIVLTKTNGQNLDSPNILVQTPEPSASLKHRQGSSTMGAMALVPCRKQSGIGFWRRLLLRRRRGSSKKSMPLHRT